MRDRLGFAAERACHGAQDVRQERRLVAPRFRLRLQVARREVGRVGLEQQAIARDLAHQLQQVLAAPLVADPAGDADVEAEVEIGAQLLALAGEAVGYGLWRFVGRNYLREPGMGVPGMEE